MKKAITFRLCVVIITAMVMTALLGYYLQTKSAKEAMRTNSEIRFNQVSEVLKRNDTEIAELRENLKEDYFIRAKAAAYIVQNQPDVVKDLEEMRKIASLLQVDELHLFDMEGRLYAGRNTTIIRFARGNRCSSFFRCLTMLTFSSART